MAKPKFSKLYACDQDVQDYIMSSLSSGSSPRSVAVKVQTYFKALTDYSVSGLTKMLTSFKKNVVERELIKKMDEAGVLSKFQNMSR